MKQSNTGSFPFSNILLDVFLGKEKDTIVRLLPKMPFGVMLLDKESRFIHVDEEFTRLTGYVLPDIPNGMEWLKKAFPDANTRKKVVDVWNSDLQQKTSNRAYQVTCKNGEIRMLHFRYFRLDDGKSLLTVEDMSEQDVTDGTIRDVDEKIQQVLKITKDTETADGEKAKPKEEPEIPQQEVSKDKDESVNKPVEGGPKAKIDTGKADGKAQDESKKTGGSKTMREELTQADMAGENLAGKDEGFIRVMDTNDRAEKDLVDESQGGQTIGADNVKAEETELTATIMIEDDNVVSMADKDFEILSGYSREEVEGRMRVSELFRPEDGQLVDRYRKMALEKPLSPSKSFEFALIDRNGGEKIIAITVTLIPGTKKLVASMQDITEQKFFADYVTRKFESIDEVIREYVPSGLMILNTKGNVDYANREMLRIAGTSAEQFATLNVFDHQEYQRVGLTEKIKTSFRSDLPFRMESVEYTSYFGQRKTIRNFSGFPYKDKGERKLLIFVEDVTKMKLNKQQTFFHATHDLMTGLPNTALLTDRLKLAIHGAQRYRQKLAIMYTDLDNFKDINHTYGFTIGDDLIKAAAERLRRVIRQSDTVARIGSDEFLLLAQNINDPNDANMVAKKMIKSFEQPFGLSGQTISITCSIGVALYPDNGTDLEHLIRSADVAMTYAKEAGRNTYRTFSEGGS